MPTDAGLFADGVPGALRAAGACLAAAAHERHGPYSGASPERLAEVAAGIDPFPEEGAGLDAALDGLGRLSLRHGVDPAHPACAAHLHCQPLAAAVAADALAAAANQSLDSWDQGPMATHLERRLVAGLAARVGWDPDGADGVVTSGGTQANLMGLLLARDAAAGRTGRDAAADGLGPDAGRYRVLCSELAHFSVARSAALLGLGRRAVEPLGVDGDRRLRPGELDRALDRMEAAGQLPMALVATAGTTDFGSIDPLPALAERAREHGLWLHVDAAWGGGLLFSDRHRGLLAGIETADSVAVDFHKLLWQPAGCGVFLVRDRALLAPLEVTVPYLNPSPVAGGPDGWEMPHLVGRSLATTRRFAALTPLLSFQAVGRRSIGELVDRTLELAVQAAAAVDAQPALALTARPVLGSVVFRYRPSPDHPQRSDRLNEAIRLHLLATGQAVVGRTEVGGRVHLKLTLLNPTATEADVAGLVALVARAGAGLEAADDTAVTTLLNCYLRETGSEVTGTVRLERLGLELAAPLRYRSATGQHAYHLPATLARPPGEPVPLGHATLADLLGQELAAEEGGRARPGEFVASVADSARNAATFLAGPGPGAGATPFLRAEQSLAAGHPLHPAAKGRQPMTPDEVRRYAPELGAAFPLHWFRADRSIVAEDSALGSGAGELLAGLLDGDRPAGSGGRALLPAHPWQAARLLERPEVAELLAAGLLEDLGPLGRPWSPTSSVRTVYRADAPFMLKLSLGARITNSVRVNLAKELARGVEVHRLLAAGLGAELAGRFPGFAIVRDPAWLTLRTGRDGPESGFEVVLRENPYREGDRTDASVVAGLCHPGPGGGPSRLATLVTDLAASSGRPTGAVATEWFRRYLTVAADPLLWLYADWGIALEAHQQNSIVELAGGWPAGFRYRDNQGYYFKASAADRLRRLVPDLNRASDTVCDDAVADERFGYYLAVNHLFGIVGTLGRDGVADEGDLLADLAGYLAAKARDTSPVPPLVATLLGAPRLRVKANLRTRLDDMDELVGPLASQSVYVEVANPLAGLA